VSTGIISVANRVVTVGGITDEVDEITTDSSSEVDSISSELEVDLVGTPDTLPTPGTLSAKDS